MKKDKKRAWRWGLIAETLCLWYLRFKGYRILASRYKTKSGEIDIIAIRWGGLAFIEVKARPSLHAGLECISTKQRERIQNAAQIFLSRMRKKDFNQMRFDVMVVVPWRLPYHLKDAWRLEK
jgi:putative endonuclease